MSFSRHEVQPRSGAMSSRRHELSVWLLFQADLGRCTQLQPTSVVLPRESVLCTGLGGANPPAKRRILFALAGGINVGLCPEGGLAVSLLHFVLMLSLAI